MNTPTSEEEKSYQAYNDGYEAFFYRGETNNPWDEDKHPDFFYSWEEGNKRAQSDCE